MASKTVSMANISQKSYNCAMKKSYYLIIVGGGAAGIFAAISAKEHNPEGDVLVLEKTSHLLNKVRISGGGRCNVTHSCFEPKQLIGNYPRGNKALIGPFTRFQPRDTIEWFESRGVDIKAEQDGRMFPTTDSSQTIIDCLLAEAEKLGVEIRVKQTIQTIEPGFLITLANGETVASDNLLLATGSSPIGHNYAKQFGHTITELVPSLFTFNVPHSPLEELSGVSVEKATISLPDSNMQQTGPLLITHWGFSGPAALKLSSWAARWLHEKQYQVMILIDWLPALSKDKVLAQLKNNRIDNPNQLLPNSNVFGLPRRLWEKLVQMANLDLKKRNGEFSNDQLQKLADLLKASPFQVNGKTTYKEEFVTCGGIALDEVNFRTMESRLHPKLYFAGEILDVDAVTGGFNFQNAWTTGWIAGQSMN